LQVFNPLQGRILSILLDYLNTEKVPTNFLKNQLSSFLLSLSINSNIFLKLFMPPSDDFVLSESCS
jgi:hypothetical protein